MTRALLIEAERYDFAVTAGAVPLVLGIRGERPLSTPVPLRTRADLHVAHRATCAQLTSDAATVATQMQLGLAA